MSLPPDAPPPFQRGGLTVHRWGRALWIDGPGGAWLIGAPSAAVPALSHGRAGRLRALILPSEDTADLDGWLALLDRVPPSALTLLHTGTGARIGALVEAWSQGWPQGVQLDADAAMPDTPLTLDGGEVWFDGHGGVRVVRDGVILVRSSRPRDRRLWGGADLALLVLPPAPPPDLTACAQGVDTLWVVDPQGEPWGDPGSGSA